MALTTKKPSLQFPIEEGGKDTLRWTCSNQGEFTTSSAWELCRHRRPHMEVLKMVWNDLTLPSISIFIWRLLANRVPVDAKLQWRHISLASKCRCCRAPDVETREHLFLQGEIARGVWEKVANWFPSLPKWNFRGRDLENRIRFWHRCLGNTEKPHASALIPCLVLWFIWSERNGNIHRNTRFSVDSVFNRIFTYLQQLIAGKKMSREQWRGCGNIEVFNTLAWKERPRKQIRLVRWMPPEVGWVKLNIAGVWKAAESGMGGVVRDDKGSLIQGFLGKATAASTTEVQLQALMKGLDIAREQGRKIWVELDNSEMVNMLQSKRLGAATLRHQVTEIRNRLNQVDVKITHILAQGNKAAAWLALKGSKEREHKVFNQESAPQMTKAMVRMDQLGLPNFVFHE